VAEPGWYPDVHRPGAVRYWNGDVWTDDVAWQLAQRPVPMSFAQSVRTCTAKFVTWKGRASLAEYWWWYLFSVLCGLAIMAVAGLIFVLAIRSDGSISANAWFALIPVVVFYLLLLLPTLSVSIRRLHDTDRPGTWMWLALVPYGSLALLVFHVLSGTPGPNRFGPVPGHDT